MVKMTNESHLLATFSKRRAGLFKKASELSTLCAAEVVIVVFSPAKKVYSFGHPSADVVITRFLSQERPETSEIEANRSDNMIDLQMYFDQVMSQLDDVKKRGDELREANKAIQDQNWLIGPFEELERPQLLQRRSAIAKIKNDMDLEMATILDASSQQFYVGSSSNQRTINTDMEFDIGYVVPSMMAPPPMYNPDPVEEYMVIPEEGTNINPTEERMAIPAEEYNVNPEDGNNINHVEGDNVILPRNDIPDVAPGFGGPYNIINPEENDTLDVAGFGGYTANPPGNDNLDSLDTISFILDTSYILHSNSGEKFVERNIYLFNIGRVKLKKRMNAVHFRNQKHELTPPRNRYPCDNSNKKVTAFPSRDIVYKQDNQLSGLRDKPITQQEALPRYLPRQDPLSLLRHPFCHPS
ncbi:hypothetical protein GQ457_14G020930 [Hibiscus cannabinus]